MATVKIPNTWSMLSSAPPTCCHLICITESGLVCSHRPDNARCPGSQQALLNEMYILQVCEIQRDSSPSLQPVESSARSSSTSSSPPLRDRCRIVRIIPKKSREYATRKLGSVLDAVVVNNDHASCLLSSLVWKSLS